MDREYNSKEERKKIEREEAQQELKRSWERHGHLKRLRALAKAGPAAVRNYAVGAVCLDPSVFPIEATPSAGPEPAPEVAVDLCVLAKG